MAAWRRGGARQPDRVCDRRGTDGKFPAVYDGLLGDFVFRPGAAAPAAAGAPADSAAIGAELTLPAELALWESIRDSRSPPLSKNYLRQ